MSTQNDDEFLKEVRDVFLMEATEMLDQVEKYFLVLEKNPTDQATLEGLFRVAHNLKGSGKAAGFDEFAQFNHEMENLLVALREKKLPISSAIISLLLECSDKLRRDVEELKQSHQVALNHTELYKKIEHALSQGTDGGKKKPEDVVFFEGDAGESASGAAGSDSSEDAHSVAGAAAPAAKEAVNLFEVDEAKKVQKVSNFQRGDEFVKISLRKIDDLLNNFGEQVILQSALDHAKENLVENHDFVLKTITQLNKLTHDLQQTAIALRMVNLNQLFSKMERAARDTAKVSQRNIEFITEGQENELDKSIVDALSDPLMHMVRNAVDHGIEPEADRLIAGKPSVGKVILRGFRRGGFFYIQVQDDGKGMDPEVIYKKALRLGLVRPDVKMTETEIFDLIYLNGFSTRDVVTDISGRGVGMNVVKEMIQAFKGTCQTTSKVGEGTIFTIRLPLTLAIFNGMVMKIAGEHYIVPNSDVEEVLAMPKDGMRYVSANERVIQIRDSVLPLQDLRDKLKTKGKKASKAPSKDGHPGDEKHDAKAEGTLMIARINGIRYALIVDEVLAQQRIVHKTLGPEASKIKGAAGATILGDGSVAVILEIPALVSRTKAAA